jgi:hypothetical protein
MILKQKLVEKAKKIKLKTMKKIETIEAISSDDDSEEEAPPIQKSGSKPPSGNYVSRTLPSGNSVSRTLPAEVKPSGNYVSRTLPNGGVGGSPPVAAPVRPKPVLPFKFVGRG